jgi:uncharacterized membrane protein YedE/YeeE
MFSEDNMFVFSAFISGLLFGIGLIVSGMANPQKVLNFLDIAGNWDPSLILVMLGAISISLISFKVAKHRKKALCSSTIHLPTKKGIDRSLVFGSILFGIGWGFAGICPGPAIVALGAFKIKALAFGASMLVAMWFPFNRNKR